MTDASQPLPVRIRSAFLARMPKAELHLHLDGSLRPSTILSLAADQGIDLPANDEGELLQLLSPPADAPSLEAYLRAFSITCSVMQTEEAIERIAFELAEDCASENILYFEVRYAPIFLTEGGLDTEQAVRAVGRGLRRGEAAFGVKSRQILCAMRNMDAGVGEALAAHAPSLRNEGVVGFDLAGGEADNPARDHARAFEVARRNLLRITVHAGEAAGPWSIADAVTLLGAERIGHGTSLPENPALLEHLADRGIVIEVCPTSNVQTGAVEDLGSHPALALQKAGLPVVICTDNRTVSNTTLTREFEALMGHHDISLGALRRFVEDGFRAAFLPRSQREELRRQAMRAFDALVDELCPEHA